MGVSHLFMHSLVDGHLGYFPLLAVVNSGAMNICVRIIEYLFPSPLGVFLKEELPGLILIVCLAY